MTQAINASGWPIIRGIQTVKDLSYLNMKAMAAATALDKLWSDTFLTNAGIYAAGSSGYTYQGTPNFNVIRNTTVATAFPVMSGNTAPSGTVTSRNSSSSAWQLIDNSRATNGSEWNDATMPTWWAYDFGAGVTKTPTSLKIMPYTGLSLRAPKNFTFQGSNNGTDWTTLYTGVNVAWSNEVAQTFSFSNTTAYRYFKLNIADNNEASVYTNLPDIQMFEAALATATIVSVLALDLAADVTQVMMFADVTLGTGTAAYYVSTDDGSTWTAVTLETLATVPAGKKIRLKVELTGDAQLESWGVAV